jgi:hypothetical protein
MRVEIERYFRDEIEKAWQLLETEEDQDAYGTAFEIYCRLLWESSEYARTGTLPKRLPMKKTAAAL